MELPVNRFKQALREGRAQVGLWVGLADAGCAEIAATAGFDWLLLDQEHAPNDVRTLFGQLQAVAPYASHPVVRPVTGDRALIKQLLDIGAQTLLVPMVESAAQAAALVAAMRYPPDGVRGVGASLARASRWSAVPDYLEQADGQMCLLVQIETKAGLENLDAIAAVPGVDGLFIGPFDLSASMGHRGEPGHPAVRNAVADAIPRIRAAGKAAGILATDDAGARSYLDMGCSFVAVGVDAHLLAESVRGLAARFGRGG